MTLGKARLLHHAEYNLDKVAVMTKAIAMVIIKACKSTKLFYRCQDQSGRCRIVFPQGQRCS